MKINKVSSTGKGYCHPIVAEDNNEEDILNALNNRDYDMSMNQFKEKALSLAQTRIVNRGYTDCQVIKVSDRTTGRIINKLHIKEGNTEETTSARTETTSCIRNTVSFIVMNRYLTRICSEYLTLNTDTTRFTVDNTDSDHVRVVHTRES
jgi:hypothetical protein